MKERVKNPLVKEVEERFQGKRIKLPQEWKKSETLKPLYEYMRKLPREKKLETIDELSQMNAVWRKAWIDWMLSLFVDQEEIDSSKLPKEN